jgi:hypothetical protein
MEEPTLVWDDTASDNNQTNDSEAINKLRHRNGEKATYGFVVRTKLNFAEKEDHVLVASVTGLMGKCTILCSTWILRGQKRRLDLI